VIGFLRIVGILNAAAWFGAALFFTVGVHSAIISPELQRLLGSGNYPFFSGAVEQLIMSRYFRLQLLCSAVAVIHLAAVWLYLGKVPEKFWRLLLGGLIALNLLAGLWLQPKLKEMHTLSYNVNVRPERRALARHAFPAWQAAWRVANFLSVAGLAVYLWGSANPPDTARFVRASKFRS
jgi:Domain of unknown function (DUF4149)